MDADEPGSPLDAATLRERQAGSRDRIRKVQQRAQQAKATLDNERAEATSPDHSVTVTVNPAGTLVDLHLAEVAGKLPLRTLEQTILRTYRQASAQAVRRTEEVMRDLVGPDAAILDIVRASAPEPVQDERR